MTLVKDLDQLEQIVKHCYLVTPFHRKVGSVELNLPEVVVSMGFNLGFFPKSGELIGEFI